MAATDVEGIFRLNGSAKRIKDLQEIFDSPERYGKGLDWTGYTVHDAANVLRRYLNQLPEPIVPLDTYEQFRQPLRIYQTKARGIVPTTESESDDHSKAVASYQQLIRDLPPLNKQLLLYILDLLAVFASKSDQNRMTSANLSAIFQPGMLSHPQHDMSPDEYKLSQDVLIFLIENQDHFLFGMNGTAADEETVKAVEAGAAGGSLGPPRVSTTTTTTGGGAAVAAAAAAAQNSGGVRRSVSSASGGADSFRKYGSLRRNVSVSSKTSRTSNSAPSPGTTASSLGGVHRSNTLPSKMAAQRRAAGSEQQPSKRSSPNRTPPSSSSATASGADVIGTSGMVYMHSATHGPVPIRRSTGAAKSEQSQSQSQSQPQPQPQSQSRPQSPTRDVPPPSASPPPTTAAAGSGPGTPTKERKLASLFSKSPPPNGDRQPNRLKKKRSPGSAGESAQSSSQSLQAATDTAPLRTASQPDPSSGGGGGSSSSNNNNNNNNNDTELAAAGATPKPSQSNPHDESASQPQDASQPNGASNSASSNHGQSQSADHSSSLKPHGSSSRTPSMTSVTDQSDLEPLDEISRAERRTQSRRSWMPTSPSTTTTTAPKKRNSEQVGLGLAAAASPPLEATNPGADRSTSSIGSWHQASRSSPSDLQQFVHDPANQPLSLDAEVNNQGATAKDVGTEQPERRSLFGKFKAKVGLSRESRDGAGSSERTKSPVTSDEGPGRSGSSLALSPPPTSREPMGRSTPVEGGARTSEDPVQSPVSPPPGGSLPPAIPEEPRSSPESPVAATAAATSASNAPAAEAAPESAAESAAESAPAVEPTAQASEKSAPAPESAPAPASAPKSASAAEPAEPPK